MLRSSLCRCRLRQTENVDVLADGSCPLYTAYARKHDTIVRMLLDAGAHVDSRNERDESVHAMMQRDRRTGASYMRVNQLTREHLRSGIWR